VTFGIDRAADVRASAIVDRGVEGTTARVTTPRGPFEVRTALVGRANLANIIAATAVALEFDVPLTDIAATAATLGPAAHRGEIRAAGGWNHSGRRQLQREPDATKRALDVLAASRGSRRVAVIGEMLELGDHAAALHAEVGRAVAAAGVDMLLAVGGAAAGALADAAIDAGMPKNTVRHFATSDEAADAAVRAVRGGDVVLVKRLARREDRSASSIG